MTSPLLIDLYPGDHRVDWDAYVAAGQPWCGAILKASQGVKYSYLEWLTHNRNKMRDAAGPRYGVDFFDGMYHYLDLGVSGALQADYCWSTVEQSGGERIGTLPLMVDVERGGQKAENLTKAIVEERTRSFAERYHVLSGRQATLYGGELLRSVGVQDRLGCALSAIALYGPKLAGADGSTANLLARTGTDLDHTMLWQYRGTDSQKDGPPGYPMTVPGTPYACDVSAVILPGGLAELRALCPKE